MNYEVRNRFVAGGVERFSVADGKVTIYPAPGHKLVDRHGTESASVVLDAGSAVWYLKAVADGKATETGRLVTDD